MKILGIDSSSAVASTALVENDILVAEYTLNLKKTHSQILLPMINEITGRTGVDLNTLDAIAIAGGPGSFTGLRIGSATAKGLGMALNIPVVSVSTLEAMAYNLCGTDKLICPVMDARRNQVYTGVYRIHDRSIKTLREPCAVSVHDIIGWLNEKNESVIILGDGVPSYKNVFDAELSAAHEYAAPHSSRQRAGAVAALGAIYYSAGRFQTAAEHIPEYLRLSQAEREREERSRRNRND